MSPVRICSDPNGQEVYHRAQTESGAIIIAWADSRNSGLDKDIYAQKIGLDGSLLWGPSGTPVVTATGKQSTPFVARDGMGGAIVIWNNYCNQYYANKFGIWAQRLDSSGQPLWPSEGMPIETSCQLEDRTGIIPSSIGSGIVLWTSGDPSYGTSLMAQKIDSLGNALWEIPGKPISEAAYTCINPRAIPDGEGGAVFSWERTPKQSSYSSILGMWGSSSNDICAVGSTGAIFHYDGQSWSRMSSPTTEILSAVWGSSTDNVFAVGSYGKILHYNGTAWTSMSSGTTKYLRGVWGSAPDTVYAVGNNGTILRFDGSTWTNMNYAGTGNLMAVHGRSGTDVYAVGTDRVLHYDGNAWSTIRAGGGSESYTSVWVSPENLVYIGGLYYFWVFSNGFILQYDGATWRETNSDLLTCSAIWGTDSSNVYALFESGNVMHYDGSLWTKSQASAREYYYALWGTAGSDIWIGGNRYCIRHFEDQEWVTQNQAAGSIYMNRIDAAGNALWDEFGAPASAGMDEQTNHYLAPGGDGSALAAWQDSRNSNWDIYARKVSISRGPIVATELVNFEAGLLEAGIRVTWQLSQFDEGAAFIVSRAGGATGKPWEVIAPAISRDGLSFGFVDDAVEAGAQHRYQVRISDVNGSRTLFETDAVSTPRLPLTLSQNVPNPFNPSTTIRYYLPERCRVKVAVYDAAGRAIASLADLDQPAGHYSFTWNGRDNLGKNVASGIYFCRLQAGKEMRSRKMVLIR
ncbi:MAG: FlgD immunoglobulin-like domain containing protein [Candidatus Krumholzibacteriia bacterium]